MKENFIELGDKTFQTVEIAETDKLKINNNSKSEDMLSMKDSHPSWWSCKEDDQKSIQNEETLTKQKPEMYLY